jgi:hypothetical protein
MISLVLLELSSVVALLFSILLIYLQFAPLQVMARLFVGAVAVGLLYHWGRPRAKIFRGSPLLLLTPLSIYRDGYALAFILIAALLFTLYLERFLQRGSHDDYVINLRRAAAVYPIAFFIRWAGPNLGEAVNRAAPFIFVYLLTAIMLIRSLRHVEAGMDIRRLQGSNVGFVGFLAGCFLIMSVDRVRQLAGLAAQQMLALLFYPFRMLLWLLAWQVELLGGWLANVPFQRPEPPKLPELPGLATYDKLELPEEPVQSKTLAVILGFLRVVGLILLIAITLFVLYKLLVRVGKRSYRGLDYIEEREYLKIAGRKRKRRLRLREKLPSQPGEQIRYYYRRFLERLAAKRVELAPADTTLKIQRKAERYYPHGPQQIRNLYIVSRYGGKEADDTVVAQMEQLYKGLEEQEMP